MSSASPTTTAMPPVGRWFRRNWKWFVPGMFAVAIVLAGIAVFGYVQIRSYRYRQNPAYQMALAEVQASKEIQERLGEPIEDSDWNPQGAIELRDNGAMGEARFNFTVSGLKESADVAVQANVIGGEWAVNGLSVRFANDEQMNLTQQVLAKQKIDTPEFDPKAERERQAENDRSHEAPAPDVNVKVPDVPPGLK